MLLQIYGTDKDNKLIKQASLYDATPLFYINMPTGENAPVFDYKNFPFEIFKGAPIHYKKGKTKDHVGYIDLAVSFDIETTTIENTDKPYAFMYQWQYCVEDYVFMGKTWEQFIEFTDILTSTFGLNISKDTEGEIYGLSLVCYIFNLQFEFTFMHTFIGELVSPLFTDVYSPLVVPTKAGITYRCAYRLTNKTLESFTKNMPHHKLAGDLDYTVIRVPQLNDIKNGLTDLELAYCYNDVKGLSEAIRDRLEKDTQYTLANIPLTSTGYVRKDCMRSMRKDPKCQAKFQETKLDAHLYQLCRMAFRGGNTHANAAYVGKTIGGDEYGIIKHYDITSSYPAQILTKGFPRTKFEKVPKLFNRTFYYNDNFLPWLERVSTSWCLLIRFKIYDLEYIGDCGVPYIARAKSFVRDIDEETKAVKFDNGRIHSAPVALVCMTEIDTIITLKDYKYSKIEILEAYKSRKGLLPYELRRVCLEYYKKKTKLKGSEDPEHVYEYNKAKELLNAIYGLLCMRIDRIEYSFKDGEYIPIMKPLQTMLDDFYNSNSSFLPYQYSLWVTSAARAQLRDGCLAVGKDLLYVDTDSVFYFGDHEAEFEKLNKKIEAEAIKHQAIASNSKGESFPIGVWSREKDAKFFRTLGAKKYILSEDGETIKATISGVSKKIGQEYFTENGFEAFKDTTEIPVSGKVSAHYNNEPPHYIEIQGVKILTGSNIALISAPYTIKIKEDYKDYISYIRKSLEYYYKRRTQENGNI